MWLQSAVPLDPSQLAVSFTPVYLTPLLLTPHAILDLLGDNISKVLMRLLSVCSINYQIMTKVKSCRYIFIFLGRVAAMSCVRDYVKSRNNSQSL